MTTRPDITFDIRRSPRITIVPDTSDEILLQDYVDTVRPFESSFRAMSQPYLMEAAGKNDIGGGKLVSITAEEQDMKLEFAPILTPAETGTVTTGSGAPNNGEITFIDTAALFETANVQRGSMVINFTDQSIADVVVVNSEISLTTKVLVNGIGNTYDSSDVYHVFNVRQVNTSGGNLTAVDDVDVTTTAISPTAFTQVIQAASTDGVIQNISGIETQIDTIEAQTTASAIGVAVWDALISAHSVTGSFGEFVVRRLLTVAKFFSLRI